ncbi:acetate--CoA ligase family protein [Pontivivens insulae]|uniref:ATP-grasp domain-containing protein n=1 Tax=Pontivivens insulae TaxID=1639689 RepID=A0A2R8A6Y8_9RHOB|nr:acetate--CoA ligase family protein [Pontivivens insulae]RED18069.1 acyl-CoA synthetase (NDP forming) [Pontivivens insulae]SPF27966.1 hypothetical protein POI8812_00261 [Pontivivens insulae]
MRGLDRLFRPRSIAVFGGGDWVPAVVEQCRKIGFDGQIWPVHPTRAEIAGQPAYRDVEALPAPPDASFIGVNRHATLDIVRALAHRGSGGAVCFASGFSEAQAELADGAGLQADLLEAAGEMPVLGPNCYGFLNYLDRVTIWPDQHGGLPVERGVAIVMQSSNIAINLTMQTRGVPIAYMVTVGNQAQTGMSEVGAALLRDPRVTALGLHIEGIGDLRAFEALAAQARTLGKSIIALKVGRSPQARAATISHTASLAGSDAGANALLSRLGIGQASSVAGFLEALKLLHVTGGLTSDRIAAMSCSGGEASLIADSFVDSPATFPALVPMQSTALRDALGAKVALANPLDYHTYIWADEDAMTATFTAMMQADLSLGIVVLDFPRPDRCPAPAWDLVVNAVRRTAADVGKPMAILSSLPETMPEQVAIQLVREGIVPLCGMAEAVEAVGTALSLSRSEPAPLLLPDPVAATITLSEAEAKSALNGYGVPIPASERADTLREAIEAATRIGFPVVVKGEGLAHKTEAGAVALNLLSPEDVAQAIGQLPVTGYLVEEMVQDTVAELLIGVVLDPAHGYVLTLAAGGTLTEVLSDSTSLLVPSSRDSIRTALTGLRLWPVLQGYRGKPPINLDALLDTAMAVQDYVIAERPAEVEINPVLCSPKRAIAADALILRKA